jgi:ATP-dependent helicase Lhr and Lhr-like helicase
VLDLQLEETRLDGALERLQRSRLVINDIDQPTPFCFPLLVEGLRRALSSDRLESRVRRMQLELERMAGWAY